MSGRRIVLLVCAAVLAGACGDRPDRSVWDTAKQRGVDFRATGNEPPWYVEIEGKAKRLTLATDYGRERYSLPLPAATVDPRSGETRYELTAANRKVAIVIAATPCHDNMSGEALDHTVTLTIGDRTLRGCGRALR